MPHAPSISFHTPNSLQTTNRYTCLPLLDISSRTHSSSISPDANTAYVSPKQPQMPSNTFFTCPGMCHTSTSVYRSLATSHIGCIHASGIFTCIQTIALAPPANQLLSKKEFLMRHSCIESMSEPINLVHYPADFLALTTNMLLANH